VAFADSGRGIDPESVGRFFEPFFTTKEGGTGLGLAIANKIVSAHGGAIGFENRTGGGAVFTITLPVGTPARARVDDEVNVATVE
jgi:two-component system sensor histidine kinase HydH